MGNLDNGAASDLELANLAAALERLDGSQLKELRQNLLPTRLHAIDTADSKLLQIPQEIRDAIYDEILESEKNAGVWFTKKPTLSPGQEISLHPLFRVCYQLREEFAMKFWKKISISQMATSIWIIERRMTKLDPKHKKFITRVEYNAGSKYETLVRGVMQIGNKECATRIAKRLENQLELKPGIVWVTFPNRFDKEKACWFNHARANSLEEVEERKIAWE